MCVQLELKKLGDPIKERTDAQCANDLIVESTSADPRQKDAATDKAVAESKNTNPMDSGDKTSNRREKETNAGGSINESAGQAEMTIGFSKYIRR